MEYLMTYGWAILIIAVVLGALFGLGFFNSASLAPKIAAGACQVYRPQGPATTAFINTEGVCNNELPQYAGQFNGATSNIVTPNLYGNTATVTLWMYTKSAATTETAYAYSGGNFLSLSSNCIGFNAYGVSTAGFTNRWIFVATTIITGPYSTTNDILYINGAAQTLGSCGSAPTMLSTGSGSPDTIGSTGTSSVFNGILADVQYYNSTLSANEILVLYQEGIGGVPQALNSLVGWWPLNGNANDYSGNLNNGVPSNMVYTTAWTAAYTPP